MYFKRLESAKYNDYEYKFATTESNQLPAILEVDSFGDTYIEIDGHVFSRKFGFYNEAKEGEMNFPSKIEQNGKILHLNILKCKEVGYKCLEIEDDETPPQEYFYQVSRSHGKRAYMVEVEELKPHSTVYKTSFQLLSISETEQSPQKSTIDWDWYHQFIR